MSSEDSEYAQSRCLHAEMPPPNHPMDKSCMLTVPRLLHSDIADHHRHSGNVIPFDLNIAPAPGMGVPMSLLFLQYDGPNLATERPYIPSGTEVDMIDRDADVTLYNNHFTEGKHIILQIVWPGYPVLMRVFKLSHDESGSIKRIELARLIAQAYFEYVQEYKNDFSGDLPWAFGPWAGSITYDRMYLVRLFATYGPYFQADVRIGERPIINTVELREWSLSPESLWSSIRSDGDRRLMNM